MVTRVDDRISSRQLRFAAFAPQDGADHGPLGQGLLLVQLRHGGSADLVVSFRGDLEIEDFYLVVPQDDRVLHVGGEGDPADLFDDSLGQGALGAKETVNPGLVGDRGELEVIDPADHLAGLEMLGVHADQEGGLFLLEQDGYGIFPLLFNLLPDDVDLGGLLLNNIRTLET